MQRASTSLSGNTCRYVNKRAMGRDMTKRSPAMRKILKRLEDDDRSSAWLGRQLNPSVTRQTVFQWSNIPDHYVEQVAELLKMEPCEVRPGFCKPEDRDPRKRAA